MTPISPALPPAQLQNSFNYEELQDKNGAAHIPFGEFRDLVNFARLYSPKMNEAIENGSLLTQTKIDLKESSQGHL
ncbi:MAG: hypothetical protein SP4CHLAM17_10420 [Chlamydiales bacterium]|nr:hypothetical protein [Chlamydiales bacterium]